MVMGAHNEYMKEGREGVREGGRKTMGVGNRIEKNRRGKHRFYLM